MSRYSMMPGSRRSAAPFREAILHAMAQRPTEVWPIDEIHAKVMREGSMERVSRQLRELRDLGLVEHVDRGARGRRASYRLVAERRTGT